jgi:hypothetical protein
MNRCRAALVSLGVLFASTSWAAPARAHDDGRPHQHTADGAVFVAAGAAAPARRSASLPFLVTGSVAIVLGVSMLLRRSNDSKERVRWV